MFVKYVRASMCLVLLAAGVLPATAQRRAIRNVGPTRLGIFAGTAFGSMTGPGVIAVKGRTGFEGGAFVLAPLSEGFALQTGISYVQKGVSDSLAASFGVFEIGYVEFPVLFRIQALPGDDLQLHAVAGIVFGFRSGCAFRVDSLTSPQTTVYNGACGGSLRPAAFDINHTDNSIMAGLTVVFAPRSTVSYELTGTWQRSLQIVDPQVIPFDAKNRVFGLTLGITYVVGGH